MATKMLEHGAELRWIKAMLGHADIITTQIYTRVSIRALCEIHRATHPAECEADSRENNLHNGTTPDTTEGVLNEHHPLQNR